MKPVELAAALRQLADQIEEKPVWVRVDDPGLIPRGQRLWALFQAKDGARQLRLGWVEDLWFHSDQAERATSSGDRCVVATSLIHYYQLLYVPKPPPRTMKIKEKT